VSIRNLDKIFRPQRVAVVGASDSPKSVGYTVLRNLVSSGFPGVIYPVNPKHEAVQGIQAYPDVGSLPRVPDLAVVCTPAPVVPGIVRQCGEAGRMVANPDLDVVEYAVFVADPWQDKGLGSLLTARCLEIARDWGIEKVRAETTLDNTRMIRIFGRYGFRMKDDVEEGVVLAEKELR